MHDEIKRFYLTGEITSDKFLEAREALIKDVEDNMRDEGYVPVLDLLPQFTRNFNPESEVFNFELSVYGAKCNEERKYSGVLNGVLIERSAKGRGSRMT